MIRPDVIVCWPRNCDYPLWRQFIRDNREKFNLVIVVFTETNHGEDYREFIRDAMHQDYVLFVENRPVNYGAEDWRNIGVNAALLHSYNSEWVWFTEQDFIPTNTTYWNDIQENSEKYDILGVYQGERLHPCSIYIKQSLLNKTSKDFSAKPPEYDHFGKLQIDIGALQRPVYHIENNYTHMNGLSHNIALIERGEAPNHNIPQLNQYLKDCFKVSVKHDKRFDHLISNYLSKIDL